ncbi:zinc finger protein 511-like [Amphibalanus amphitrite]|uniref:zinc finger protein 511-like n=1 Tax=Amphibalanus amphitrite TaxID=1232801 RepID=UPI001C905F87|nr:zinc finger protein 511-like [Amphibalanus amphitrite]XP_043199485.1 zinc finger protein 511-like [Amphibalanus amphitrite]
MKMETSTSPLNKEDSVWTYLRSIANKRHPFSDPLYKEGNEACRMQLQYVAVDEDDDTLSDKSEPVSRFQCAVPGCGRWLGSVLEQEVHYSTSHRHSCGLCRAQLPSFHLLQLHLEESHDSLFAVRAQRQPMYRCFLESCDVLSADADSRREHCTAHHCFPADFCYSPSPPPRPAPSAPSPFIPSPLSSSSAPSRPQPRLRFSYTVPEHGVSFGAGAVRSLGREMADGDASEIDMASLAAALEPETL